MAMAMSTDRIGQKFLRISKPLLSSANQLQKINNSVTTRKPGDIAKKIIFTNGENDGSQSYLSEIRNLACNVPKNVRDSFRKHNALQDLLNVPKTAAKMDALILSAKQTATSLKLGPKSWHIPSPIDRYAVHNNSNPMKTFHPGLNSQIIDIPLVQAESSSQTSAYHYSHVLVPREVAFRFPLDMLVDPVYATSIREHRIKMKPQSLWPRLHGKVTFMVIFSGQPLSTLNTGTHMWRRIYEKDCVGIDTDTTSHLVGINDRRMKLHPIIQKAIGSSSDTDTKDNSDNSDSNDLAEISSDADRTSTSVPEKSIGRTGIRFNSGSHHDLSLTLSKELMSLEEKRDLLTLLGREPIKEDIKLQKELQSNPSRRLKVTADGSAVTGESETNNSKTQFFQLHCCEGWFSRRSNPLTKQLLRGQVEKEDIWNTFLYKGKINGDLVSSLQLYNKELPTCLLIDKKGYIRWHAIGLPNDDAEETLIRLYRKLRVERS